MNFLRTLFWIVLAVAMAVFAVRNWTSVTLNLRGGMQADAKLRGLLLLAFLAGAVPVYLWQRAVRWRIGRRAAAGPVLPADRVATGPQDPLASSPAIEASVVPVR